MPVVLLVPRPRNQASSLGQNTVAHLLCLSRGPSLQIPSAGNDASYSIQRGKLLTSIELSELYLVQHSELGNVVVVKVVKPVTGATEGDKIKSMVRRAEM